MRNATPRVLALVAAPLLFAACGEDTGNETGSSDGQLDGIEVPGTYAFDSRFVDGQSSVAYDGQIFRHLLLRALSARITSLTADIDAGTLQPAEDGDVVALLDFYFRFDGESYGSEALPLTTTPATLQSTWEEVSSGKDLVGKIAGNDSATDHVDFATQFAGWADASLAEHGGSISSPEGFVIAIFETLEQNALARANGEDRLGPDGASLPVHITEDGVDLQQLNEKFLIGALFFHQGADDYLDDGTAGKGILSPNTQDGTQPYSTLEHQWDEGFGYFGAARNYGAFTDEEIAAAGGRPEFASGYNDADGDGTIDLQSEFVFGMAVNAARRDRASVVATDFSGDAFDAFLTGRAIIAAAGEPLNDEQFAALEAQRDVAVATWERVIVASGIHYLNRILVHMSNFGTDAYSFADHAKHFGELKGFLMAPQFNPASPLSDTDFDTLHELIGDAPALPTADASAIEAYRANLLEARALLGTVYGFDAANLGDDNGTNGW